MRLLDYVRSLLAKAFHGTQIDDEMEEELRSHVRHRADDIERAGLGRAEAERLARLEFGAHYRFKEECGEQIRGNFLETFVQDVRYSYRLLRKSRGFTVVAVVTLALAIGANAIVFSVMDALIIRPLDVPRPESLYALESATDKILNQSYPDYSDFRARNRSFEDLAAFTISYAGLDTGGYPTKAWVYEVSGNYFDALGIQPYLGGLFHGPDEHGANSAPYVVLAYNYWHVYCHDDRGVVGRTVRVNGHPFEVVGVAPPGFHGTVVFGYPDFFVPLVNQEQIEGVNYLTNRGASSLLMVMGHLKTGITPGQAAADLNAIGADLVKSYPNDDRQTTLTLVRPGLFGDYMGPAIQAFVVGLMLLAGLILLAACANLGSLFAARAADRSREVALRLALGASRTRILRQLFTESVLVSIVGGAVGLWASVLVLRGLSAWRPLPRFPIQVPVNPDASVYAMALLLAVMSGLLFGAVPVRQVLRTDPYRTVKAGSDATGSRLRVRDLLLAVQIAICAVLVTSSLVAVRGLVHSMQGNFGFEPENSFLVDTDLSMAGYSGVRVPAMQRHMLDALRAIPGVDSVGLADTVPLGDGMNTSTVFADGATDLRASDAAAEVPMSAISPGYFQAAGTSLVSGRDFTWMDDQPAPRVAIVNQQFARRIFGSTERATGGYYKMPDGSRVQVVGTVEDGKYGSLTEAAQPAMFFPILQAPSSATWLVVRSRRDPSELMAAMRTALRDMDSTIPVVIQTRFKGLDTHFFAARTATIALGIMGVMGAMLAVTGIFGMAAHSVGKRMRELGIRVAVGGQRKEVLQAALGRAFRLLTFGSAAGLLLGILASRVLAAVVYQATPRDPLVLAGVVLAMAALGLVATFLPARRALSIDPMTLLRDE